MFNPVIKWSGSKRSQAERIKKFLPESFDKYYEPFIGGGSMLYAINPEKAVCGDICRPLIDLWNKIKNEPEQLAYEYSIYCGVTRTYRRQFNLHKTNAANEELVISLGNGREVQDE